MKIGIIDAEMIFRSAYSEIGKHRFPNLASLKISSYHKSLGDTVTLITEIPNPIHVLYKLYDKIYISKVFVETSVPTELLNLSNVVYGGTGFYYANSPKLQKMVEHCMPDYTLYNEWIKERKEQKIKTDEFTYYEDYSMGFSTRGCVRQCKFCINQHCAKVEKASPISEFLNPDKPKICLLDDNILAYENWREVFDELNATGKWFEFKQGLDIRALTEEKAEVLANSNININTIYFAFDNIKDKELIVEKLRLWRQYYRKNTHMYVLCGFDENNQYDEEFWVKDIENTLERIKICIKYGVFPYVMRHRMYNTATNIYRGMYINLSAWCNQKSLFSKWSLNEWADNIQKANEKQLKKKRLYSSKRYLMEYSGKFPDIAYEYFDLKYNEHNECEYEKNDSKDKYGKKKRQKVIFSIQHSKKSIKFLKVGKTDKNKPKEVKVVKPIVKENIAQKSNNETNILNWFASKEKEITNGVVTIYSPTTIQSIKKENINLILLNIKEDKATERDFALLKYCSKYLVKSGHLYIMNSNLKSFNIVKTFIENNTSLKYKSAINFKEGGENKICSYYVLENNLIEWVENSNYKDKALLFRDIIAKCSNEKDIILSFFNRYDFIEQFGKEYLNRGWICVKKKRGSKGKWEHNNVMTLKQENLTQTSLLDTENKNIG